MSVNEAYNKLSGTSFERGILPDYEDLKPQVKKDYHGNPEWVVLNDDPVGSKDGWWCPLLLEPAGEDGTKVRVENQCSGPFSRKQTQYLDELVDATLTGREPKFD